MRIVRIIAVSAILLIATGCSQDTDGSADSNASDGLEVAAAFFPLAEVVRQVGGSEVEVTDLTPPGAEPHDLELTSTDVETAEDADLLLLLGGGFQPSLESLSGGTRSLVVLDDVDLTGEGFDAELKGDPHIWLDPLAMAEVVTAVADELGQLAPDSADTFEANAERFTGELETLHAEMEAGLKNCTNRTLVTAHDAFGWMASRYDLIPEPVAGLSPDQEPDPARLAELSDLVEREGVTTIFTEELVSPRVAEALAREAKAKTAVLNPLESAPDGGDYLAGMRSNLEALTAGLGCG